MKSNTSLQFGKYLLDDQKLRKLVSKNTYKKYIQAKTYHRHLSPKTLNTMLKAIMEWAISEGATHYLHIFYPLFRPSAEKGVALLSINKGSVTSLVPPSELMRSEVDASSFPNGNTCQPHKAKGYAVWDIASNPYIACDENGEKMLYLPSKFYSSDGICLDEKTPLQKATIAVDKEARRVLYRLGGKARKVICNVGAEQEFFLIKKALFEKRYDLKTIGRAVIENAVTTLPTLSNHYLSRPNPTIANFFNHLSHDLWEKGIASKIRHSEVSPSQYEITTIFGEANKIFEQNNEIVHSIKTIANKFGLEPLFHEKPFCNINGSGKHINLSFSTNKLNLLDPISTPFHIFYVFFTAFIVAVDTHKDLILNSVTYYSNALRLGQKEAPPSHITIHIGDALKNLLLDFNPQTPYKKPIIYQNDDRNRTSPLAFVKNRFEFRMAGSSQSIAFPLTALYVAFSNTLKLIADESEKEKGNRLTSVLTVSKELFEKHKRIIYNDDNYSKEKQAHQSVELMSNCLCPSQIKRTTNPDVLSDIELHLRQIEQEKKLYSDLLADCVVTDKMLNKFVYPSLFRTLDFYRNRTQTFIGDDICKSIMSAINNLSRLQAELADITNDTTSLETHEKTKWLLRFAPRKIEELNMEYEKIKDFIPREFETFPSCDEILKPL